MNIFNDLNEVEKLLGEELGKSAWKKVSQSRIWAFGRVTNDNQWIHTNTLMAKKFSPYKKPIAHGFLVLSFIPSMLNEIYSIKSVKMAVNYGLNKVRFTAPVVVNSRIRASLALQEFKRLKNGAKLILEVTIEIEGESKPACVAEQVILLYE